MASTAFGRARRERVDRQYGELRSHSPDELQACVARASAIGFNHRLASRMTDVEVLALVADIEQSLVECALRNRNGGR